MRDASEVAIQARKEEHCPEESPVHPQDDSSENMADSPKS